MLNSLGLPTLPTIDPTHFTALHSIDLGEMTSPDGRAHPVDAHTPVVVTMHDPSAIPADPNNPGTPGAVDPMTGAPMPGLASSSPSILGFSLPQHFGARLAIGVLAVGLLLIVAFRLVK